MTPNWIEDLELTIEDNVISIQFNPWVCIWMTGAYSLHNNKSITRHTIKLIPDHLQLSDSFERLFFVILLNFLYFHLTTKIFVVLRHHQHIFIFASIMITIILMAFFSQSIFRNIPLILFMTIFPNRYLFTVARIRVRLEKKEREKVGNY